MVLVIVVDVDNAVNDVYGAAESAMQMFFEQR